MSKNQFPETATQTQRNRKFCQFNKDHDCTCNRLRNVGGVWITVLKAELNARDSRAKQ